MILHEGKVTEMGTGEGKTLVATLPAYLNALEGKGVHIVTVNTYLAGRDAEKWTPPPLPSSFVVICMDVCCFAVISQFACQVVSVNI
jgi:hypothetical protein